MRLLVWGALALTTGAAVLAMLRVRRARPQLLRHFAAQNAVWGAIEILLGILMLRTVAPRDLARATRLVQTLWLEVGLTSGALVIGLTLAFVGWHTGRREGMVGAGLAVALHGAALLVLHLRTLQTISGWM